MTAMRSRQPVAPPCTGHALSRLLAAIAVLACALLMPAIAVAALPPGAVPLGPADYEYPAVLVSANGTVHVAYAEKTSAGTPVLHYKRRLPGATAFLDNGTLALPATANKAANLQLIEDVPRNRLLLIATDNYQPQLWVSSQRTGGTWSWSGPTPIWDSLFAARSFALRGSDGALGFVPELTGVYRWVIPPGLTPETKDGKLSPTNQLIVSDRIGSRLDIDLGYDGATMVIAFDTVDRGAYLHVSDQPASDRDVKLPWGGVATKTRLASCPVQGAGILLHDEFATFDLAFVPVAGGAPGAPEVITDHRGTGNTAFPFVTAGPSCTFAAAWVARDGSFVLRRRVAGAWGGFQTLLAKEFVRPESAAYEDIAIGGAGDGVGAMAWYDGDSKQMVFRAFDASATDAPKPLILPGAIPVVTLKPAGAKVAVSTLLKLPGTVVCSPSPCSARASLYRGSAAPASGNVGALATLAAAKLAPGQATRLTFSVKTAALRKLAWRKTGTSFVAKVLITADVVSNGEAYRVVRTVTLRMSAAAARKAKLPGS